MSGYKRTRVALILLYCTELERIQEMRKSKVNRVNSTTVWLPLRGEIQKLVRGLHWLVSGND